MKFGATIGLDHLSSCFCQGYRKAPSVHAAQCPFDEGPGFQAVQNAGEAGRGEFELLCEGARFKDSFVDCTEQQCIIE